MSLIYLDSCIIIYIVEKHPDFSGKIESLRGTIEDSEICYIPLSRLECLVMPYRSNDFQLVKRFNLFFDAQQILTMPVEVFDEAAKLRAKFAWLKTPDALHLAAAHYHNCDELWTNDDRLIKVAPDLVKNII